MNKISMFICKPRLGKQITATDVSRFGEKANYVDSIGVQLGKMFMFPSYIFEGFLTYRVFQNGLNKIKWL